MKYGRTWLAAATAGGIASIPQRGHGEMGHQQCIQIKNHGRTGGHALEAVVIELSLERGPFLLPEPAVESVVSEEQTAERVSGRGIRRAGRFEGEPGNC